MEFALDFPFIGQIVGFVALALCAAAFASKDDDTLLAVLILGNVTFAVQFACFGAWSASGISALIILRIVLARRLPGNWSAMLFMAAATSSVAALTWQGPSDFFPLAAGIVGTVAMFMLRGIPMRVALAFAALCWIITNAVIGSLGALAAEALILTTNLVTIVRMARDHRRRCSAAVPSAGL